MIRDWLKLIISISVCLLAGFIGSVFTQTGSDSWYATLDKPSFNPPGWVFAPVWTSLYILMGISVWLIWKKSKETSVVKTALYVFIVQLILNALWSFSFFKLQSPFIGFINIILLLFFITITVVKFWNIKKSAGYLLVPYLLWVLFASALNFSIMMLN